MFIINFFPYIPLLSPGGLVMKKYLALFLIPFLFSCNNKSEEEEETKHTYEEVSDRMHDWSETLSLDKDEYFVYCYSSVCKYCEEIKNEVIDIALKKKPELYFCNQNVVVEKDAPIAPIGESDINKIYVRGFPTIIKVKSKVFYEEYLGKTKVLELLRS